MTKPPSGHLEEPDVVEVALADGAKQMRAVLDDGYDDETALYSALEVMGLASTPPVTVDDVELVAEALTVLKKWRDAQPLYEGGGPKALHYRQNARVLEVAIAAVENRNWRHGRG
jgi:hypothetical protein